LWSIFEIVRSQLVKKKLTTFARLFTELAVSIGANKKLPFDFAVIDEAQDISISHLRFLASLGTGRPDSLFFAGDLGQRIFQQPFSWKALGVDIRGRSRTLRINYRTSHQIRQQADKLLGPITSDIDGNAEDRTDTISVFNGPEPLIRTYESDIAEINAVAKWIADHSSNGLLPQEFGVFVRSDAQIERAKSAVMQAGLKFKVLDDHVETASGYVSISTMHLAKGLEFRAVIVMACDDEVLPLQGRIQAIGDDADLQEVYDTERHLLYVACTRARDFLFVSGVDPSSEFLDDMSKKVSIRS
jgi:superfamily I DNA/RNA helicase